MEAPEALATAAQFLSAAGFSAESQGAFQIGTQWRVLDMRRGGANARTQRQGIIHWPQQVRIEWDRGRVDVAASITPVVRPRGWGWGSGEGKVPKPEDAAMRRFLLTVPNALELLLSQRRPDQAQASFDDIERLFQQLSDAERRRKKNLARWLWIILGVIVALIVLVIVAANRR